MIVALQETANTFTLYMHFQQFISFAKHLDIYIEITVHSGLYFTFISR